METVESRNGMNKGGSISGGKRESRFGVTDNARFWVNPCRVLFAAGAGGGEPEKT